MLQMSEQQCSLRVIRSLLDTRRVEAAMLVEYNLWRDTLHFIIDEPEHAKELAENALRSVSIFKGFTVAH